MFPNIPKNLSGGLGRFPPSVAQVLSQFLCGFLTLSSLIPASCSGCGPGYRSPLDAMKGEMLV